MLIIPAGSVHVTEQPADMVEDWLLDPLHARRKKPNIRFFNAAQTPPPKPPETSQERIARILREKAEATQAATAGALRRSSAAQSSL